MRSLRYVAPLLAATASLVAQRPAARPASPTTSIPASVTQPLDSVAFGALKWREIGPHRGGRSAAVAGSTARPNEYYFGTTGGGVYKSVDGGQGWIQVTDKYFGGTIGAIGIAPSNPDVVYVGGGEFPLRGNVSHGDGVWKTTDGGKTWTPKNLADSKHIADLVVHPTNPDLVYAGVLGHAFGANATRGVYRSKDGGATWQRILFRNDSTGVVDLVMDPNNPNVLYAGFWQVYRTPWMLNSGGAGSGMFKTTDGGDTWMEITRNPGLPAGIWGDIGISVSAANSNRVYAIIEAKDGGVYRSDDAGATWQKMNGESSLTQRAWYYMKIHADPKDQNVVYVNNVSFQKSTDGGKTFRPVRGLHHGDSHDFWIAQNDANRMIEGDDGGAEVSTDGGRTWTDEDFATAQFYHVIATTHFPYQVCGAQQDNSTLCGPTRTPRGVIDENDWKEAGGGESGWIAARADNPDIVYAGSYGAYLTRKDMRTGLTRNVNPWPDDPMGHPAGDLKYRFQWTYPILVSPHNSNVVYAGSQHVHKTTNGGESWTVISPDLSYNDKSTLGNSGGPLTLDQTSVEYYGTVFVLAESPRVTGLLWVGTDDGRVWITRDGGAKWTEVTPKDMAKYTRVSSIDPSAHADCVAYVAANRYQLDDDRPYLWKTSNCGASWTRIDQGIAETEFTRVVREDPDRRGLLIAGTERGVWFSPSDGASWQRLQLNLPRVPVHDLVFKDGDVVAATHGRSFWSLDNISSLEQLSDAVVGSDARLLKPRNAYRVAWGGFGFGFGGGGGGGGGAPQVPVHPVATNPPSGPAIQYWLKNANAVVTLSILDSTGALIRSFTSNQDSAQAADSLARETRRRSREDSLKAAGLAPDSIQKLMRQTTDAPAPDDFQPGFRPQSPPRAPNRRGMNTFSWDMRYPSPSAFRGMILWGGVPSGAMAPPGTYQARLVVNGQPAGTEKFRLIADPRVKGVTAADYAEQFRFIRRAQQRFTDATDAVLAARQVAADVKDRGGKIPDTIRAEFEKHATALLPSLSSVEDSVYQGKSRSSQDPLNYPIRLNNKLGNVADVAASSDGRPTKQTYEVYDLLSGQLDREITRLKAALTEHLDPINQLLVQVKIPEIRNPYRPKPIS